MLAVTRSKRSRTTFKKNASVTAQSSTQTKAKKKQKRELNEGAEEKAVDDSNSDDAAHEKKETKKKTDKEKIDKKLERLLALETTLILQICDTEQYTALVDRAVLIDYKSPWTEEDSVLGAWPADRACTVTQMLRRRHFSQFKCVVLYAVPECPADRAVSTAKTFMDQFRNDLASIAPVYHVSGAAMIDLLKRVPSLYKPHAAEARQAEFLKIIVRLQESGILMKRTPKNDATPSGYRPHRKELQYGAWSRILPWLYLSNQLSAQSHTFLHEAKIDLIVSVGIDVGVAVPERIQRHFTGTFDDDHRDRFDMRHCLPAAVSLLEQAAARKQNVLVHCHAGFSRSSTVVLAFLMRHFKLPLLDAYLLLCCRRCVGPHLGFLHAVQHFVADPSSEHATFDQHKPDWRELDVASEVEIFTCSHELHVHHEAPDDAIVRKRAEAEEKAKEKAEAEQKKKQEKKAAESKASKTRAGTIFNAM